MNNYVGKRIKSIDVFYETQHEDGVQIILSDGTEVLFTIANGQYCCEDWGYISSIGNEDAQNFVGSVVHDISVVTKVNSDYITNTLDKERVDYDNAYFIRVETDQGDLEFAVYNEHNGYYGHDVRLKIGDDKVVDSRL